VALDSTQAHRYGIYLLPNLFTTGALAAGFYALIAAIEGAFAIAAMSILIAMVLDGLDGRIARLTGTESAFGAQYDSLSDMVSFGVAPALTAYLWTLASLGHAGSAVAFAYLAATAFRLARFNATQDCAAGHHFTGLPSPAAAAVLACWMLAVQRPDSLAGAATTAVMVLATAALMVSRIRYLSFKQLPNRLVAALLGSALLLLIVALVLQRVVVCTGLVVAVYAASGPLEWLRRRLQ
jgi:CDP-diacylglycerol---serine O-phosphatidyltransferase